MAAIPAILQEGSDRAGARNEGMADSAREV